MAFQGELQRLHDSMLVHASTLSDTRDDMYKAKSELAGSVFKIGEKLGSTHESCLQVSSDVKSLQSQIESESVARSANQITALESQLLQRDAMIDDLSRRLQLTGEDYAARVESIMNKVSIDESGVAKLLEQSITELRVSLCEQFQKEREVSLDNLKQLQVTKESLQTELDTARQQLRHAEARKEQCAGSSNLAVSNDAESIVDLQTKVNTLEADAEANSELRRRWLQDLNGIDFLRSSLSSLSGRLPQIESISDKLSQITQLNSFIQSTAQYLSSEQKWIKTQLSSKHACNLSDLDQIIPVSESKHEKGKDAHRSEAQHQQRQFRNDARTNPDVAEPVSVDTVSRRRVIVKSPTLEPESPSTPPSIEQEQRQRRESTMPRSILRSVSAASRTTTSGFLTRLSSNHSQYNRPVASESFEPLATSGATVAERIRSCFVDATTEDWNLTSVHDFERSSRQLSNQEGHSTVKHTASAAMGEERKPKRQRLSHEGLTR